MALAGSLNLVIESTAQNSPTASRNGKTKADEPENADDEGGSMRQSGPALSISPQVPDGERSPARGLKWLGLPGGGLV